MSHCLLPPYYVGCIDFFSFFFLKVLTSGVLRRFQAPECSFDRFWSIEGGCNRSHAIHLGRLKALSSISNRLQAHLVTYERFRSLTNAFKRPTFRRLEASEEKHVEKIFHFQLTREKLWSKNFYSNNKRS